MLGSARRLAAIALGLGTWSCGGGDGDGGTAPPPPEAATELAGVTPAANATGVPADGPIVLRFSGPMGDGMEQYVDLHLGPVRGAVVPMSCGWSADRTALTCAPDHPLEPGTHYTVHVGGGMMDAAGHRVEVERSGGAMGGMPVGGGMMGGMHGGTPTGMMGPGWRHGPDGHLGMTFEFTTA